MTTQHPAQKQENEARLLETVPLRQGEGPAGVPPQQVPHGQERGAEEEPTRTLSGPSLNKTNGEGIPIIDMGPFSIGFRYKEPKALRIQREGMDDLIIPLYPDRSYVFGRSPESTVVFPQDAVSRQHGTLFFRQDHRWVYRDLNSLNDSFLGTTDMVTQGDERHIFQAMNASQDWVLEAGHVLLLGNGRSRIVLLSEVPHNELVVGARRQHVGSPATVLIEKKIETFAHHELPIFIFGKSGSGKTYYARRIHEKSRPKGQFVLINCGRLPQDPTSLHSELLGHVKGAFTGADSKRIGKFHSADGGTLFLDEVEFLPPIAQNFLIDVLERSGNCAPLGAPANVLERHPYFRLISASKKPLAQSGLRPDLVQRLVTGKVLNLPTLEERREDIPNMVETILHDLKLQKGNDYDAEFTSDALAHLQKANWPGQIRELEATVNSVVADEYALRKIDGVGSGRMMITLNAIKEYFEERSIGIGVSNTPVPTEDDEVTTLASPALPREPRPLGRATPPTAGATASSPRRHPSSLTEHDVRGALTQHQNNKTRAAQELGIALNTLKDRMKRFGITD